MPATPIFGLMMRSALRTAGASLVTEGCVIIGIAAAPEIATLGALLSLLFVMMTIIQSVSQEAIDLYYPRSYPPKRLRYYADKTNIPFILDGFLGRLGLFYVTDFTGDYGEGVYTVDPLQRTFRTDPKYGDVPNPLGVNPLVKCPPTQASSGEPAENGQKGEIARLYNIPRSGQVGDGSNLTGYIELVLNREGYYKYKEQINGNGANEFIFRGPFFQSSFPASKKIMIVDGFNLYIERGTACY